MLRGFARGGPRTANLVWSFPAVTLLGLWVGWQLLVAYGQTLGLGHVSALAHLGGVLTGLFFVLMWKWRDRAAAAGEDPERRV